MAVPVTQKSKQESFAAIIAAGTKLRSSLQSLSAESAAGDTAIMKFVGAQHNVTTMVQTVNQHRTTAGLQGYARNQFDAGVELAWTADVNAMRSAAIAVRAWLHANIPESPGGAVEQKQKDADGNLTDRVWTPAESAGFRTEVTAFLATVT